MIDHQKRQKTSLSISVVGHTNTGKTSFLRSLLRDQYFGKVENRAGTTRHVEALDVSVSEEYSCRFFDTPGMEDATGILDELDKQSSSLRDDSLSTLLKLIERFIQQQSSSKLFEQEMKVLRQAIKSDLCIYVIDARQSVLGKYRDELQLLACCGKPVLPLLNFTQSKNKTDEWKSVLASLNLHVVADFDTVLFNQDHEKKLFEKMKLLVSKKEHVIEALLELKARQWDERTYMAAKMIATSLIDLAAWQEKYTKNDNVNASIKEFQEIARAEENNIVENLLNIYEFPREVIELTSLDIIETGWTQDLFDANTWALYGLDVGSSVVKGGAVGFSLDLMTGGLSLGLGALLGASAGLAFRKGKEWAESIRGYKIWRLNKSCLQLIYTRQQLLLKTLASRRHARLTTSRIDEIELESADFPGALKKARFKSYWSRLNKNFKSTSTSRSIEIDNLLKELL